MAKPTRPVRSPSPTPTPARTNPSSDRAEYLLVDGHSVIFSWPELKALNEGIRRAAAREELISILTQYQDQTGIRVVLVFDGHGSLPQRGKKATDATTPGGIQIFYASGSQSADTTIERLVANYSATYSLIVATNDHLEQQTVISFGADRCWTTEELRSRVLKADKDFTKKWLR